MRSSRVYLTTAALLLLANAPLGAQQPGAGRPPMPHGPGMQAMMMDCPMMTGAIHTPMAALQSATALGLNASQRNRLQEIQRRLDMQVAPARDSMRAVHAQLATIAGRPQLDETAARAALERMNRGHTAMGLAMLRAAHDVDAVLTPAQRDSLGAMVRRQMPRPGAMPMSGMPMHSMPGTGTAPKR